MIMQKLSEILREIVHFNILRYSIIQSPNCLLVLYPPIFFVVMIDKLR